MEDLKFRSLTADEIECRVAQCGPQNGGWCSLLLYKDARCDQRLLDETVGCFRWKRSHELINGNLFCTVSIKDESGEWVSKQDVGTESYTEKEKGQASDAFKRACFNWGLGRELYTAPKIFISLGQEEISTKDGKTKMSPRLSFKVSEISYDTKRNINRLVIIDNNGNVRYSYGVAKTSAKKQPKSETKNTADNGSVTLESVMKEIGEAQSNEQLLAIHNKYVSLQKDGSFIKALTDRKNKLMNEAHGTAAA